MEEKLQNLLSFSACARAHVSTCAHTVAFDMYVLFACHVCVPWRVFCVWQREEEDNILV